jgi:hypothetical protein
MTTGQTLYNGIRLPAVWPPRLPSLSLDPTPLPPYLVSPPEVIPIDVGRQLFVDDFLIEETTLRRTFHAAEMQSSPALEPDRPWEQHGDAPAAMTFSDGAWYDPHDRLFKMWYMGGLFQSTCYAVSEDGLRWEKRALDVVPGTNIVLREPRDSTTVWLDLEERDPRRRCKLFRFAPTPSSYGPLLIHFSADGIHWSDVVSETGICVDRTTVFRNPFRNVWGFSVRDMLSDPIIRARRYFECTEPTKVGTTNWELDSLLLWTSADKLDPPRADTRAQPQLYNLDAAAYESVLLGLFSILRGVRADGTKTNDLCVGFSRDGFHWHRPNRQPFVPVSESASDWNYAYLQSAGGCCVLIGERLHFHVGARGLRNAQRVYRTGLATLRRDGFASMDAGDAGGTLTTRPVTFRGNRLFVNLDGELRAEVIAPGTPVTLGEVCGNSTRLQLHGDLSAFVRKPVRFRFHLTRGELYSFWIE